MVCAGGLHVGVGQGVGVVDPVGAVEVLLLSVLLAEVMLVCLNLDGAG